MFLKLFYGFSSTGKSKKKEQCKNSHTYPLIETQYCPCDKYNAQPVGNWSDCILPEGKVDVLLGVKAQGDIKECGQGYRYQAMACYDQNGRLVETSRCNSHGNSFFSHDSHVLFFLMLSFCMCCCGEEMLAYRTRCKWNTVEHLATHCISMVHQESEHSTLPWSWQPGLQYGYREPFGTHIP